MDDFERLDPRDRSLPSGFNPDPMEELPFGQRPGRSDLPPGMMPDGYTPNPDNPNEPPFGWEPGLPPFGDLPGRPWGPDPDIDPDLGWRPEPEFDLPDSIRDPLQDWRDWLEASARGIG